MSINTDEVTKPLDEVGKSILLPNAQLQTQGKDVATIYIVGPRGIGKSTFIKELAKQYDCGYYTTHLALKSIEELTGIPEFVKIMLNGKEVTGTEWSFPGLFKPLIKLSEEAKAKSAQDNNLRCVFFHLQDCHLMGSMHLPIMFELLTERKIKDFHLPDNVVIVMDGNHGSSKSGAKTMFAPIANRVAFCPVHPSFDYWKENYAVPNGVHPAIIGFLSADQYRPFFNEEEQVNVASSSPRSWARFSEMLTLYESTHNKPMPQDLVLYECTGHNGKEAASEFAQNYLVYTRFDFDAMLADADNFELPNEIGDRFIIAHAMTAKFAGFKTAQITRIVPNFAKIVIKFIKEHEDLGLMIVHDIIKYEHVLKKSLYNPLSTAMNTISPEITTALLERVANVK